MLFLRALHTLMLLLAVALAPAAALAQEVAPGFVHRQWTARDGLPLDGLNDVLQTRDGYLWIATWDGLARFDGVRFVTFNMGNTPALRSNRITRLLELPDGTLRVLTARPAGIADYRDGHVSTPFPDVAGDPDVFRELLEDPDGGFWLASDVGLYRFPAAGPPRRVLEGSVTAIARDAFGRLWVGRRGGGGLVELRGANARRRDLGRDAISNEITALLADPDGTLWIGSVAGLYRLRDERVVAVPAEGGSGPHVHRLQRDAAGSIWVGEPVASTLWRLDGERLVRADPSRTHAVRRGAGTPAPDGWSVAGSSVQRGGREVLRTASPIVRHWVDREENLWLATFNTGLYRLRRAEIATIALPGEPRERRTHGLLQDAAGTVWISSPQGALYRWEADELRLVPGADGRLWLGADLGRRVWAGYRVVAAAPDSAAARVMRALQAPTDPGTLGVYQDRSGAWWLPHHAAGIRRFADGGWTPLHGADYLATVRVGAIHETRDGAVWLLTAGGGLVRYRDGRFERLTAAEGLAGDVVRGFHEDADGVIWVGSFGRGLSRIERAGSRSLREARIRVIGTRDGLPDDVVNQILEDDEGRLWMGSNRGIFRVRRADLNALAEGRLARLDAVRYDEEHGMGTREVNGGGFPSALRSRDGRLWFPTQDGVAVVDPRGLRPDTTLRVLIEAVAAGDSVLPTAGEVRLSPRQRDLEISYTAPSFTRAEHLRFRYRLEGWHDDWVEAGTRRAAYFTNLPPGRYAFRVAATHGDGRWVELAAPLQIAVTPRLHETGAFRLAALLALALALAGLAGWRASRLRARARELERLVSARTAELRHEKEVTARQAAALAELDRAKSHFFANVSHELRTPLTLIVGPLRDLAEGRHGALPAAAREQHGMMLRNAQRLLRLINQLLDLARLEGGALTLDTAPRDLVELARGVARSFAPLAERRGIALAFQAEAAPLVARLDAEQMEKVLLNLLSNAFKFTAPGGRVEVRVAREGEEALVEVRDTGIGIAPEKLPRVFERFYQADASATRRHEGSGIGLSLAKELAELHGGTITARSQPGEGSTFVVRLPLGPPLPDPLPPNSGGEGAHQRVAIPSIFSPPPISGEVPGEGAPFEPAEEPDRTTVLVVDDNADVRAYVRSVLAPAYRVIEAADGEEGLERAREALPDLVLADVMMPRLDGISLARTLREDPLTDCIPVILLTARAEASHEVEGLRTGADDYVTKPFDSAVLAARVANLIASRRRLRERFHREGLPTPQELPAPSAALEPAPQPSALELALRAAVEANLTDPGFNPEALAAAAGLSYKQMYRRLREELDATPSHFIRTVRVERAAGLLRDGAGSVTEVAYAVGFNSLSHFNRCFRERFGIAPSESLRTPA